MVMSEGVAPPYLSRELEQPGKTRKGSTSSQRAGSRWGRRILTAFACLVYLYLFLPLITIIVFTFNDPAGRYNISWDGFTINNWLDPFKDQELTNAFIRSLEVAVLSISIALIMGSLVAIALARYRFTGSRGIEIFLVLRGFDWTLEDAAMDLGASPWRSFRKITFPLILPGIVAAALLSFALSLDDYIVTDFTKGEFTTFPIQVNNAFRVSFPPQVNVLATIVLIVSVLLLVLTSVRSEKGVTR